MHQRLSSTRRGRKINNLLLIFVARRAGRNLNLAGSCFCSAKSLASHSECAASGSPPPPPPDSVPMMQRSRQHFRVGDSEFDGRLEPANRARADDSIGANLAAAEIRAQRSFAARRSSHSAGSARHNRCCRRGGRATLLRELAAGSNVEHASVAWTTRPCGGAETGAEAAPASASRRPRKRRLAFKCDGINMICGRLASEAALAVYVLAAPTPISAARRDSSSIRNVAPNERTSSGAGPRMHAIGRIAPRT